MVYEWNSKVVIIYPAEGNYPAAYLLTRSGSFEPLQAGPDVANIEDEKIDSMNDGPYVMRRSTKKTVLGQTADKVHYLTSGAG